MAIKQMGVRMDTGSPEYRWRKAQKSSQESLIRLIDIAIENYGYVDLVDAIVNDAIKHTQIRVNSNEKEIVIDLSKSTDERLNKLGKQLMKESSQRLKKK